MSSNKKLLEVVANGQFEEVYHEEAQQDYERNV
jgi:hypothetical protein